MSPKRAAEQAERERAESDAAESLTNAFLELVSRKDRERREQLTTYRTLVVRAADGGGQLPQSDIERLVEIVRELDLSVDEFSADVAAYNRDQEHESAIAAIVAEQVEVARERDASATLVEQLSRDWAPVRDEYETRRREHDDRISRARRALEQATNKLERLYRDASKRGDRQTYDRSTVSRVWGRI